MSPASLVAEVRGFLDSLRLDLPEVFANRPQSAGRPGLPGRARARSVLAARAGHWSRIMGVEFHGLSVKDQRTLWGSCSRRGNLNFNWRLVLAPDAVLDYVVVHELAHLAEMNHSRRFWSIVERFCPDHKDHRRWLRVNSGRLRAPAG